ncbi:Crp/Fnr family transcriptional regulator [Rhodovibrio salinarum]|uniref:Crp/Fnr family transcriptional regulator n=1 Tax=Rhodovibrio salinarum TaxID=1087 RepID=A0A934UZZ4_9PROT|nr:Crp/Fnr family transcriptional regulator [Rhodovibrio salinarum]MBK1697258.1 Crp/Fnr family transcriptional regulator [Rhodovibrio salinarum]
MKPGAEALHNKLSLFIDFEDNDNEALDSLIDGPHQQIPRGTDIVTEGEPHRRGHVILDGWAASYKTLPDGRRQILSFLMPGDIVGLFAPVSAVCTASVATLNDLEVATFMPEEVVTVTSRSPRLGVALGWAAAREHEILAEHLVNVGRRSAAERVAHLFLEFWARLRVRGLTNGKRFTIPVTQTIIADTLGLSVVHVNRTLRQLSNQGILESNRDKAVIVDLGRLQALAGFSEDFLLNHYAPHTLRRRVEALDQMLGGAGRSLDGDGRDKTSQPQA